MTKKRRFLFWIIFLLALGSIYVDLPEKIPVKINWWKIKIDQTFTRPSLDFGLGKISFKRDLNIKRGLDLAGGAHLVFRAKMDNISEGDREEALKSARDIIERRVDLFGLSESSVRTSKMGEDYRITVELAGLDDVSQAIDLIGQTAQLDFRLVKDASPSANSTMADLFENTQLSGKYLKKASPVFNPKTGEPAISLEFTNEGGQIFSKITSENVGRRLAIFLDQMVLMAPVINEPIESGQAQITGKFTVDEAKRFSAQLNGGALPVPFELIEQRNVGPVLGEVSIQKSLRAGLIGLAMVVVFMIGYYGWLGFLADLGLIVYGLVTLALYKLIPVTLTLPGIAGFILSIGMAVDSNILIFERMKEETRAGQDKEAVIQLGFGRAWDSIRDANICTLIICFLLFNPFDWGLLNTSGLVRGFALTLAVGAILSLFTGIIVTRTFLDTFSRKRTDSRVKN